MNNGELKALTDQELRLLWVMVEDEVYIRAERAAKAEDDERRRASIRRGDGDPGPRR